MGKLEKSFYWLSFFLVIYITIGFKLVPSVLKEQLVKNLDENLTQKTDIGKVEFNPFTFKATIHDFKISDENKQTTISFKEFSIDFTLIKSIEKQHISFKEILLKDAFVNILEEKDGSLNLTKILKPSQNQDEIKEEKNSLDIEFLVSKIVLENANIKYSNQDEIPYFVDLKNINYTLYDLGTYKNSLTSNDLKLKLNESTNITIGGAFKLQPFKAYGKILIEDLRLKEFLTYKKDLLNFDLDEKANLNLELNYNLDTTNNLDLKLHTNKFEFNNLNLTQNKTALLNLEKIDIKTFTFDLQNQDVTFNNIDFNSLKANMILNKNGINFANLINQTNQEEPKQQTKQETSTKEEIKSKPWNINLSNVKLNNSDFIFDDKINSSLTQIKNFNINLNNLKVVDSDIELNTLVANNPNISFKDNKNNLSVSSKNTKIDLDKLSLKNSILDINKIDISKDNLNFSDKKSNINLDSDKINVLVKNLQINNSKTSIEKLSLKTPKLNFDDIKSKMKIETSNINLAVNSFLLNNEDISIKDIKLIKPSISMKDKINNIQLDAKDIQVHINNLVNKKENLSINFIKLLEPKLEFLNTNDKTKIMAKNLDLEIKKLSNSKKNGFKIEKTNLNKPNISIVLAKKDIQTDLKEVQEEVKIVKKEDNKTSKTKLNIGPLNITNGIFSFEDKNLALPFKTTITQLNGKVSEFKNNESSTTDLSLNGVVDQYGVAKITGVVHPNNIKFLTDINMKFQNIAMQNFTPYTAKFIGRELKSGKLDLDLKYNIEQSNLDAKNSIIITKLELGNEVQSPDAVSLPLGIAISLLEDSNGVIDINLPVSGNVDDPQFSIGSIVWKAFVNLITKAVTAPFSLLGAIFNFDESEINSVKFDLLENEITPIQKETLDKIALILNAKKEIAIKVSASYDENKESLALKEKKYLDRKNDDRNLKKEEINNLISKEKVDSKELELIAKNRILNIKNYLTKEKAINEKQIVLNDEILTSNSSIDLKIEQIK